MSPEAFCLHRDFEPADPAPFQIDRHYLLYASSGTLRLEAGGVRWTLPPARAALIAAEEPVSITILTKLTSASVLFAADWMARPPPVTVFDVSPLARELIGACRAFGQDSGPLSPYARSLFGALASVALRLAESPAPLSLPVPASALLRRALDFTEAEAGGAPTFETIAGKTGQSPRSLSRRFALELGMTWRQALCRIRMIRAVEALAAGPMPVTEVAFLVGYNSVSAFNAAFRDLLGTSPTEYRDTFLTR